MYESPIKMYMGEMQEQIKKQTEEELMVAVNQTISYAVDKEELIKALQYDREQYEKGYRDCKNEMLDKVKQAREDIEKIQLQGVNTGVIMQKDVLAILDKLIAESEGVNENRCV